MVGRLSFLIGVCIELFFASSYIFYHRSKGRTVLLSNVEDSDTEMHDLRFQSVGRLYHSSINSMQSPNGINHLKSSHICVIGLGGVGSWAVEALARSGIGKFTLVDLDDICISNTNRQSHALTSTIGKFKADTMKHRILDINPDADVTTIIDFITANNADNFIFQNLTIGPNETNAVSTWKIERILISLWKLLTVLLIRLASLMPALSVEPQWLLAAVLVD